MCGVLEVPQRWDMRPDSLCAGDNMLERSPVQCHATEIPYRNAICHGKLPAVFVVVWLFSVSSG